MAGEARLRTAVPVLVGLGVWGIAAACAPQTAADSMPGSAGTGGEQAPGPAGSGGSTAGSATGPSPSGGASDSAVGAASSDGAATSGGGTSAQGGEPSAPGGGSTGVTPGGHAGVGATEPAPCTGGLTPCGTECADLASSADHCGACDQACAAGTVCSAGECTQDGCAAGETPCNQDCADLETSTAHCGACDASCPLGQICVAGDCVCPGQSTPCAGTCVDTGTDPRHCGRCGLACESGQACEQGLCTCPEGQQSCREGCIDTRVSDEHCGACDNPCAGNLACNMGQCQETRCPAGQMLCDGTCTDVATDANNCGACGKLCLLADCCQGECVTTLEDPSNCGGCGTVCAPEASCQWGTCSCPETGQVHCADGCIAASSDPINCGGCGVVCEAGSVCEAGACVCPDGLSYCDHDCKDLAECSAFEDLDDPDWVPGEGEWNSGDVCPDGTELRSGTATWYSLGALGHCSLPTEWVPEYYAAINDEDYGTASACGACARVSVPSGASVDVMIVDECPYPENEICAPGSNHIDLSQAAFQQLADLSVGIMDVTWQYVACEVTGDAEYAFKDGSSSYWTAVVFRNYPVPIRTVQYQNSSGAWREMVRMPYNYWVDTRGFGTGPYSLRVTDLNGNSVMKSDIPSWEGEKYTVEFESMADQFPGCE